MGKREYSDMKIYEYKIKEKDFEFLMNIINHSVLRNHFQATEKDHQYILLNLNRKQVIDILDYLSLKFTENLDNNSEPNEIGIKIDYLIGIFNLELDWD